MYSIHIKNNNHVFGDTVRLYRKAVDYLIRVCMNHWKEIEPIKGQKSRQRYVETLVHAAGSRVPVYDFDTQFYKFPSYLLRSSITEAIGKVSSYQSNHKSWENADPKDRGSEPGHPRAGMIFPCLYRGNCFVRTGEYTAKIKVFIHHTWDWITVPLRKSDADYISRYCADRKECAPVLQKRGKRWSLDFCYKEESELHNEDIYNQRIIAVDLGINSSCTCSVMCSDGTVLGRHFLHLSREYDCFKHKTDHIRRAQHRGSRKIRRLWRYADGVNDDIAEKTAQFIIDTAVLYQAHTIVFEHLDFRGRKKNNIRLHLWKSQTVQNIVANKAHRLGMRISRICAWNTSRLAYDGSGEVLRGRKSSRTNGSYSVCEFSNGRVYNCDLNASYNIGARYFVREILKTLPVTEEQRIRANVPGCAKRITCTLATLISLNSELWASASESSPNSMNWDKKCPVQTLSAGQ